MERNEKFSSKILGFRSGKVWKRAVSILYFCVCVIVLLAAIFTKRSGQITMYDFLIDKALYLVLFIWLLSPYVLLSNTAFRGKMPLFKQHTIGASLWGMVIVSVLMLFAFGAVYTFHSNEYKADMKNHAFIIVHEDVATCEKGGKIHRLCEYCGKESVENVSAFGHSMKEVLRKEATEFEDGEIVYQCQVCHREERTVIKKCPESTTLPTTEPDTLVSSSEATSQTIYSPEQSDETQVSAYAKLSDSQFATLTELVAKSFYSFLLTNEDYQKVVSDSEVAACLKQIHNYAYDHFFAIDPEYKQAFEKKYEIVKNISNFEELEEKFMLEYYLDFQTGEWIFTINAFAINPDDCVKTEETIYMDAEGYLNPGVELYWEEDGKFENIGKIEEVAYQKKIDGVYYGYAIKIQYYDDPYSSGWYDGEHMLTTNKKFSGKPLFYIDVLDVNRRLLRENLDYSTTITWENLSRANAKPGTDVYYGALNSKGYIFTIVSVDVNSDKMIVRYANGNVEEKSYQAIADSKHLYVKK